MWDVVWGGDSDRVRKVTHFERRERSHCPAFQGSPMAEKLRSVLVQVPGPGPMKVPPSSGAFGRSRSTSGQCSGKITCGWQIKVRKVLECSGKFRCYAMFSGQPDDETCAQDEQSTTNMENKMRCFVSTSFLQRTQHMSFLIQDAPVLWAPSMPLFELFKIASSKRIDLTSGFPLSRVPGKTSCAAFRMCVSAALDQSR